MDSYKPLKETSRDAENPPPPNSDAAQDPPPTNESIYKRARAKRTESSGTWDFVAGVIFCIVQTTFWTVFLVFMLALHISMIVMGAKYQDHCPAESNIPISLMGAGTHALVLDIMSITINVCVLCLGQKQLNENRILNLICVILGAFLIGWFFFGSVMVYRTYGKFSTTDGEPSFCDPTFYWFAFSVVTGTYVLITGACCFACFLVPLGNCLE